MPKHAKPLTDLEVRNAKAKSKAYTLADGNGLYLAVSTVGSKTWVVRYRLPGSRTATPSAIGHYPAMLLSDARIRAIRVQQDAKEGKTTPGIRKARQIAAAQDAKQIEAKAQELSEVDNASLRAVARRWLSDNQQRWADQTYRKAKLVVESYFIPALGDADMRTLATKDIRPLLLEMSGDTPQLARKAKQFIGRIVDQAIDEGLRGDESRLRLDRVLPTHQGGHMPAVTDSESQLGDLMRAIDGYGNRVIRAALLLTTWTAMRPGVIASARWAEIDWKNAEWNIPGREPNGRNRMKTGQNFSTSLPTQAVEVLQEMHQRTMGAEYIFPPQARQQSLHLSRDSLSKALREMGFRGVHTPHGFRATLRTIARERLNIDIDVLEAQLAHAPKDEVEAAYARVKFREKRREVMQAWADYLGSLQSGASVVTLRRRAK